MNAFVSIGKMQVKDKDTKSMLDGTKVSSKGKDLLLDFAMPIEDFQALIQKELSNTVK